MPNQRPSQQAGERRQGVSDRRRGRVLVATSGRYQILDERGNQVPCRARRRLERLGPACPEFPVPGDWVEWTPLSGKHAGGVIYRVHPRSSEICRTRSGKKHVVVANLDQLVVVMAVRNPSLDRGLLDRLVATAEHNHIAAHICLHKIDLTEPGEYDSVRKVYWRAGYQVLATSCETGEGIEGLRALLCGHISAFMGPSGAGKSRLIATLQPGLELQTGDVSAKSGLGRHTTTRVDLHATDFGALLADTPGVRDFSPWQLEALELRDLFPEFRTHQDACRFATCSHDHEPGCAVKRAVETGEVDAGRHNSYRAILSELRGEDAKARGRPARRQEEPS